MEESIARTTVSTVENGTALTVSIFPLLVLVLLVVIISQIFIVRSYNKRWGLILPFIWFAGTIILMLTQTINHHIHNDEIFKYILIFLAENIPTCLLLLIMFISNGKAKNKKSEIDVSKIKDLE